METDDDRKRILVVEDDVALLEVMTYVLQDDGYAVSGASDGLEGLTKALEGAFGYVLLDVDLPQLSGTEVGRRLRADDRTAGLKLIMHTALDEADVRRAFDGYDAFARKTDDVEALLRTVHSVDEPGDGAATTSHRR